MQKSPIGRRQFIKVTGLTGAAFILGIPPRLSGQVPEVINMSQVPQAAGLTPFVLIEPSGKITIMNNKPEMGQGTFQAIPALIAEELEVSLDQVTILQTGGEKAFGPNQSAGGSYSVRGSFFEMRSIGAAAREMLISAASKEWNVPIGECFAQQGRIIHKPSGNSLPYGDLALAASKLEVPQAPKLKDPKDFKLIGKAGQRPDVPLKSSGRAVFGIDVEVPDMWFASVERCPVLGGKLLSFDATDALRVKGVKKVVKVERAIDNYRADGVAVIAENYWAALSGRKALQVTWDYKDYDAFNSADYEQQLRDGAKKEGVVEKSAGNFEQAFSKASAQMEAMYETPMVSHSPLEPQNCVASWQEGKIEVWASTQVPDSIRNDVPREFGLSPGDMTVHTQFSGGAFGRRLFNDFVIEAIYASKAVGRPVKVIWTREDDTTQGPFRPMTFSALKGGLSAEGKIVAFQHKVMSPSIDASLSGRFDTTQADGTMMEGISHQAYQIPNVKNSHVYVPLHVPLGYWRAVTSTTTAFAHECFIDEMAIKAGQDPLAFRLAMMDAKADSHRVLRKLKEVSNWERPLPQGWGRGLAQWEFFAGLAAQVVEVSKKGNGVRIEKVYCVIDLGTVVNPDNVQAQVEGAIVMAITAATKDGITLESGQVQQTNFHDNRLLRLNETPEIEVHILAEGGPNIKGVGEPGLPPLAPALANAVFNATGVRVRRLPFDLTQLG